MAASKTNFFKDHYDWLVAAVGIVLLVGVGFLFVGSLDNSPEKARAACESELNSRTPNYKKVPSAEKAFETLRMVQKRMVSPSLLEVPSEKEGSFLASECRVHCQNPKCRVPIPAKSKICKVCNTPQQSTDDAEVVRGGIDADQDGLPDAWELKYGLNPNDPTDAKKDLDGDTFTNLEEFEAKTDPKNPDSHPEFLDFLATSGQLKVESLKFWFERADATSRDPKAGDWRITFVLQGDVAKEMGYDARRSAKMQAKVGEEIVYRSARPIKIEKGRPIYKEVKSGWSVLTYNKKEELVAVKGSDGLKRRADVSTVELERITDKRKISVQVGVRKPVPIEEQIELVWNRDDAKPFTVTTGSKFKLKNREYEVKKLAKDGNACKVTILDLEKKTEKIIQ